MKKTAFKYLGIGAAIALLCMCKKDQEPIKIDSDTNGAFIHSWMEHASNDIDLIGFQAADNDTSGLLNTCAVITRQQADTSNTDTLTVDFGGANCLCSDGKTRNGRLEFVYPAGKNYKDSALVIACRPNNYFVDGSQISGTKYIVVGGINSQGNWNWSTTEALTLNKVDNGGTVTWNATKTVEILNTPAVYTGALNPISWAQAKTGITGSTNGIADDGKSYTASITGRLVKDMTCAPNASTPHKRPFVAGVTSYQPTERVVRKIDYGQGTCDVNTTILIDGSPYIFGQ